MRVNVSIEWPDCPGSGRIEVTNGEFVAGTINIGNGWINGSSFGFSGEGTCKMVFVVEADSLEQTIVCVCGVDRPFTFVLADVPSDKAAPIPGSNVPVAAEVDPWGSL
jgi:hypothetical protein